MMTTQWLANRLFLCILILLSAATGCSRYPAPGTTRLPLSEDLQARPAQASPQAGILGAGDEIQVTVWRKDDLTRVLRVGPKGRVFYPLVGEINVAGLRPDQLRDRISQGLQTYYQNPQVNVDVLRFRSRRVHVLGEVAEPGSLVIEDSMTVLDAIALCKGFARGAKKDAVILIHREQQVIELSVLDIDAVYREGDVTQNRYLQGEDIVFVPETAIESLARYGDQVRRIFRPIVDFEHAFILGDEVIKILENDVSGSRTVYIGEDGG